MALDYKARSCHRITSTHPAEVPGGQYVQCAVFSPIVRGNCVKGADSNLPWQVLNPSTVKMPESYPGTIKILLLLSSQAGQTSNEFCRRVAICLHENHGSGRTKDAVSPQHQ